MSSVVLVVHLLVAIGLVGLVLMQRSEGGALGIGGGSNSLISGRGAADVLARVTGVLALVFFITSISLTVLGGGAKRVGSVLDEPSRPSFLESILPKKAPDVVTPPTTPAPQFPTTSSTIDPVTPASAPAGDIVPPPAEAIQRAGPIDATPLPLKPTPAAKPATSAPKPVAAAPTPKPTIATLKPATTAAAKPAAKPAVGAAKPAPASGAESGEPAAPPGRAGPDE